MLSVTQLEYEICCKMKCRDCPLDAPDSLCYGTRYLVRPGYDDGTEEAELIVNAFVKLFPDRIDELDDEARSYLKLENTEEWLKLIM